MFRVNLRTKRLSKISVDRGHLLAGRFPFCAWFDSKEEALQFVRDEGLKGALVLKGFKYRNIYDVFYK